MRKVVFSLNLDSDLILSKFRIFDVGKGLSYVDDERTKQHIESLAQKSFEPTLKQFYDLARLFPSKFKLVVCVSGSSLDFFDEFAPQVVEYLNKLNDLGVVEFLGQTYYSMLDLNGDILEFERQVVKHKELIMNKFSYEVKYFKNFHLSYSRPKVEILRKLGFKGVLSNLKDFDSSFYASFGFEDDFAFFNLEKDNLFEEVKFRFNDSSWDFFPLSSEKFVDSICDLEKEVVVLNFDCRTFGAKFDVSSGIFDFLKYILVGLIKRDDIELGFLNSSACGDYVDVRDVFVKEDVSMSEVYSKYLSNKMQLNALDNVLSLERRVFEIGDDSIISDWRILMNFHNFFYMNNDIFLKKSYEFSYENAYDFCVYYMNIVRDLTFRVENFGKLEVIKNE